MRVRLMATRIVPKQKFKILYDSFDVEEVKRVIRSFGVSLIDTNPDQYDTYWDLAKAPEGMDRKLFTKLRRNKFRRILDLLLDHKWKVGSQLGKYLLTSYFLYVHHQRVNEDELLPILLKFGIYSWTDGDTTILSNYPVSSEMAYEIMGFDPQDYEEES